MAQLDIRLKNGSSIITNHPDADIANQVLSSWSLYHDDAVVVIDEILASKGWDMNVSFRAKDAVAVVVTP